MQRARDAKDIVDILPLPPTDLEGQQSPPTFIAGSTRSKRTRSRVRAAQFAVHDAV